MNISFTSLHFDADIKLKNFVSDKINKLTQFKDDIISAEVIFKIENTNEKENKVTEIKLEVPGSDLFASKTTKSFEESTDNAVEALRKQIIKLKEKNKK